MFGVPFSYAPLHRSVRRTCSIVRYTVAVNSLIETTGARTDFPYGVTLSDDGPSCRFPARNGHDASFRSTGENRTRTILVYDGPCEVVVRRTN